MLLNFNEITIHNFLSIGDTKITLDNNGIVLIEGENRNEMDLSLSNGSGKSSIFNAICWVLTGETIQGVGTDIVNIYGDGTCFVMLNFTLDDDKFEITRIKGDKSNLKIVKNGEDISGKGIREGTKMLEKLLPDLTDDLIGSIIILGQGLPHRFSNNTPSGRKEILEKLSKSDFMIEDLKERLSIRKSELDGFLRRNSDELIKEQALLGTYEEIITDGEKKLDELNDCEEDTTQIISEFESIEITKVDLEEHLKFLDGRINEETSNLVSANNLKDQKVAELESQFNASNSRLEKELLPLRKDLDEVEFKISHAHDDVCPTCGQIIPDKEHIDVGPLKIRAEELKKLMAPIESKMASLKETFQRNKQEASNSYDPFKIEAVLKSLSEQKTGVSDQLKIIGDQYYKLKTLMETTEVRKQMKESNIKQLKDTIALNLVRKNQSEEKIVYYNEKEEELSARLEVISQMSTIVKRDFRGYLLSNVIDFISIKAKEYANVVFGNDLIDFSLNGNNIDIGFNGKPYENLSGGEKQKVDLILQFAIRDMLSIYLNVHCNILVLDEIFDSLDSVGCNKVLNLISMIDDISSIYIISHHANELKIPYDKKIKVIKDNSGISKITQ